MVRRSEREKLGDLKGSSTERAIAARGGGISKQPFDLILSIFQESCVRDTRWKGVGILGINLRHNDENGAEMPNRALTYLGYVFRVGEPGRIYFVLYISSGI